MAAPRLELYTDLKCNGGTFLGEYNELHEEIDCVQSVEENRLRFVVPRRSRAFRSGSLGQVVRFTDHQGGISEWPIVNRIVGAGRGRNTVSISCGAVADLLGRRGLVRETTTGGQVRLALGFGDMDPTEILQTYVLTNLAADDLSWIELGTIGFTELLTLDFTAWTRLQLIEWLVDRLEAEWRLNRNGDTSYQIDIVEEISSLEPTVLLHTSRQILGIETEEDLGNAAPILIPLGGVPDGGIEPAKIDETVWEITDVTGVFITVDDPDLPDGPIRKDGQWAGNYLQLADGTFLQIDDSQAPATFECASAGTAAVGQKVLIVNDSSGTSQIEVRDPDTVADPPNGLGPIVGTWEDTDLRGEANFIANAYPEKWPTVSQVITCRAQSTFFGGTSINVKDVPAGLENQNCVAILRVSTGAGTQIQDDCFLGAEILSGIWELQLSSSLSINVDDEITLHITSGASSAVDLPTGWSVRVNSDLIQRRYTQTGDLSCFADGTQSNVRDLAVRSLTANAVIGPGDQLDDGSTDNDIEGPVQADGSGNATIALRDRASFTDGDSLTIHRPSFPDRPEHGTYAVVIPRRRDTIGARLGSFESPAWFMPYDPARATLVVSAGLTYLGTGEIKAAAAGGNEYFPPRLALRESPGGSAVVSVDDIDRTLDASGETHVVLRAVYPQTADKTLYITVEGLTASITNWVGGGRPLTVVRWIMLHRGPEASISPVGSSYGNRLLGVGHRAHAKLAEQQGAIELPFANFGARDGLASERMSVRGNVRAVVPELSLDLQYKAAVIRPKYLNPLDGRVTLVRRLEGFTELALTPFKGA